MAADVEEKVLIMGSAGDSSNVGWISLQYDNGTTGLGEQISGR